MRDYTRDLLERECRCWTASQTSVNGNLEREIARFDPDLVVVDAADFPACCKRALEGDCPPCVIVVGPEPDVSHRSAVLAGGARSWIARERLADELGPEMRRLLGCTHGPVHRRSPSRR
jgi:hypothetical protein